MIAIIDYDAGNIKSVEKAFQFLKQDVVLTRERDEILNADAVVLPGVGSFGDAMMKLEHYGLADVIREVVKRHTPFLGICLGLQLLFDSSDETPGVKGLGILPGKIIKIPDDQGLKVPHIGWNSLDYVTHIHASVEMDNVFACQFHPEKSSDIGLKILNNFIHVVETQKDK